MSKKTQKALVVREKMSQVVYTRTQEEYEDDFEKDLDWLISEGEGRSEDQDPDNEDIEAQIDKELEEEVDRETKVDRKKSQKEEKRTSESEEERWPSPMEPLEFDSDRDSPYKGSLVAPPPPVLEDQPDEEKKYILEKIQLANRQLQDQEAPDMSRRKRLHFKETLVDLVVPPLEYEGDGDPHNSTGVGGKASNMSSSGGRYTETEKEVSGKLSELKISPREGGGVWSLNGGQGRTGSGSGSASGVGVEVGESGQTGQGRVLVEKDGKFDLVSLKEVESHGLLPPLASCYSDNLHSSPRPIEHSLSPNKIPASSHHRPLSSSLSQGIEHLPKPKPPSQPRNRPNSASHTQRGSLRRGTKRRVQSASGTPSQATFTLSSQQKDLLQKTQERRDRLAREEEQRKHEEEEQKRQENEMAFRAWLMRKREQLQSERRIHRAQEMERMNGRREHNDPDEAFKSWMQRKHEQQLRERQLQEMKRLEEESGFYLHNRQECERAFKLWLKRKRVEKRVEQQAARERSRRLVVEERRARRKQDLLCTVNEAKPFRFNEHLAYHF